MKNRTWLLGGFTTLCCRAAIGVNLAVSTGGCSRVEHSREKNEIDDSRNLHLILILIEESCVADFHEVPRYSRQDYSNDNGPSSSVADS